MSKKIKIVDIERFVMEIADGLFYQIVEFFKVRIQYRKNLIFMWKNIDKRWRIFATCYVRPYSKDHAETIAKNIEEKEIKILDKYIPGIVYGKILRDDLIRYGFVNRDRRVSLYKLKFSIKKTRLEEMDASEVGKL